MSLDQRIDDLRGELEAIDEPYDWARVEAWASKAKPFIRERFPDHLEDFEEIVSPPRWLALPRVISRHGNGDSARASAIERESNTRKALSAQRKILAFLDGLKALVPFQDEGVEPVGPVFISHGRSPVWQELQLYIEKTLDIPTVELSQRPNRGRTLIQKLADESADCSFAVIIMTGDDKVDGESPRARENVIHEIGYFQGKFGLGRVCLLYQNGTNIPSNIGGIVYLPFNEENIKETFGDLTRELDAVYSLR